jgi:hypothetical protein
MVIISQFNLLDQDYGVIDIINYFHNNLSLVN